ncbi:MAG: hypothetical protein Q8P93_02755 [bacterium]|nr:hypothetical protein [bacterium]
MFNFFKKKKLDETWEEQRDEVLRYPARVSKLREGILAGENCDQITGAVGEFGRCATNPIPVNGPFGEIKYMNKLKVIDGPGFVFHRPGSVVAENQKRPVDIFEIVSIDGRHWDILYFNMWHPRRSTIAPKGCWLEPFHEIHSRHRLCFGSTEYDDRFPFGLPDILASQDSLGEGMAKRLRIFLAESSFIRPESHNAKLREVSLFGRSSAGRTNAEKSPSQKQGSVTSVVRALESGLAHKVAVSLDALANVEIPEQYRDWYGKTVKIVSGKNQSACVYDVGYYEELKSQMANLMLARGVVENPKHPLVDFFEAEAYLVEITDEGMLYLPRDIQRHLGSLKNLLVEAHENRLVIRDRFEMLKEKILEAMEESREQREKTQLITKNTSKQMPTQITILGEEFDATAIPKIAERMKEMPHETEKRIQSIANAWHEGSVVGAVQALESDLEKL